MGIIKQLRKRGWMIKSVLRVNNRVKKSLLNNFKKRKEYYPKEDVNANIKDLMYCLLCPDMCRFDCPAVQASKKETHSPATKAQIGYYLEMNRLEKKRENIMPLFEGCVHCSGCQVWCPFDFAVGDLLEGVASDLYEEGKLPLEVKDFSTRIRENNGLYKQEKYQSSIYALEALPESDYYYFPGCVTMGNNTKVIKSIVSIAQKSEAHLYSIPSERKCCGAPSLYAGDVEEAKRLAEHNIEHFRKQKIKAIVCECPECVHMLTKGYEKLGFKHNMPVIHISEWIWQLFNEGKFKLLNGDKSKKFRNSFPISYHDPCVLARKMGKADFAYKLLTEIFPKNFKENQYSRELTHCCGYGGLVNIVNPEIAAEISKHRLAEFANENTKTIITACPTCWYSFMKNNEDMAFEILDLIEVLSEFIQPI